MCSETLQTSPVAEAIRQLEDTLRMFGREMVPETDPRANNSETHASPAHMVGYASVAIRSALHQLRKVKR